MKLLLLLFFITALSFTSMALQDDLGWLAGEWEIITSKGRIIETWQKENGNTLKGKSYFISANKDSTLQEKVSIIKRDDSWYYVPTVTDQNDGKAVEFKVVFLGRNEFVCENQEHDFPQLISYRRVGAKLYASIEGKKNGKFRKSNFDFVHVSASGLNGVWVPVKQELGGKELPATVFENQKLIMDNGSYTVISYNTDQGSADYHENKIDIRSTRGVNAGKEFKAIYKYENDLLTICYNLQGDSYPASFTTSGNAQFFLSVFKKL